MSSTKSTAEDPVLCHTFDLPGSIITVDISTRGSTTTFRSDTQGDRLSFVKVTLTDADKNDDQATDVGAEQEVTGYYGFDDNLSKMSDFLNEVSEKYSESDTRLQHKEQYSIKTPRPGMVTGTLTIAKQEIARRKASQTQALKEAVLATLKELLGLPYDHLTIEESPVHADLWQAILSRNEARGPEAFDRPYCQRAFFAILKHTDKQQRADSEMMASVIDEVFEKLPLMVLNALQ